MQSQEVWRKDVITLGRWRHDKTQARGRDGVSRLLRAFMLLSPWVNTNLQSNLIPLPKPLQYVTTPLSSCVKLWIGLCGVHPRIYKSILLLFSVVNKLNLLTYRKAITFDSIIISSKFCFWMISCEVSVGAVGAILYIYVLLRSLGMLVEAMVENIGFTV